MATWLNMRNRILCCGDSITVGLDGMTGGWRKDLKVALNSSGKSYSWAGPYSDATGSHRGLAGDQAAAVTSAFTLEVQRRAPTIIILGWGINDSGTAAAILTQLANIQDWAKAGAPSAHVFQLTVMPYPAGIAKVAEINAGLPAVCSSRGVTLIDVGNPARDAGGVHPIDGPTGYDLAAIPIAAAVVPVLV